MPLNIDWQQILLHLFNFVILAAGLTFLLFNPVRKFLENRRKHFEEREDSAARKEKSAAEPPVQPHFLQSNLEKISAAVRFFLRLRKSARPADNDSSSL